MLFLLFACNVSSDPSEKQIEFAKEVQESPIVLNVEWSTSLIMDVTVNLDDLGINPEMQAQLLADEIASAGLEYTGESICVKIYYGYLNKLAESCFSNK